MRICHRHHHHVLRLHALHGAPPATPESRDCTQPSLRMPYPFYYGVCGPHLALTPEFIEAAAQTTRVFPSKLISFRLKHVSFHPVLITTPTLNMFGSSSFFNQFKEGILKCYSVVINNFI